jgi:hypothetical protein
LDAQNPNRTYSAGADSLNSLSQMQDPADDAYGKQKLLDNAGITSRERDFLGPSPTKSPTRTYSADAPLHALTQMQDPADDAYKTQKEHDDKPLTLKEKDFRITKTVPVPDAEAINPKRAYSASEPSNALALT